MQDSQKEMMETHDSIRKRLRRANVIGKLQEEEKIKALKKSLTKSKIINDLIAKHHENETKIKELSARAKEYTAMKKKVEEAKQKVVESNGEIKVLRDRLAAGQSNAAKLYADIAALKLNSRRLYGILHRAMNAVKEALKIYDEPEQTEEVIANKRIDLLNNLLQILNRAEMSERERYLTKKISLSYKKGDLGFVPRDAAAPEGTCTHSET